MSTIIPEADLAAALTIDQSVEAAYALELAEVASRVQRNLPTLIECEKEMVPYVFVNLRSRLRQADLRCEYIAGIPREGEAAGPVPMGLMGTMISQIRNFVRGAVERRVLVLPHLDLLTTSTGGLTSEAREVIVLLYENPELVWVGFKDPSFQLPDVITNLFPYRTSLMGIGRDRLKNLVVKSEARKFGREFNPWSLYKYVSGLNAVRLRRLLSSLEGEDFPADPKPAYRQLRQATLTGTMEIPDVNLDTEIGGYAKIKDRLKKEILDVLARRDRSTSEEEIRSLEELIPRGMIFWGPPGTGKTYFAKAVASAIGATITVVSGPELKSKWVGESEENLRQIFHKARQSAPSIIVFDELDSFASARGTYTGSGVEHSMVNQLLTEMDGFHKEELVFVVGTTNFVESLDPALMRPGRFEFHLHIPYPDHDDRRDILKIYNRRMRLQMTEEAIEFAVNRTDYPVPGAAENTRYSGDHIQALCRSIARARLRHGTSNDLTTPAEVESALTEWIDRPKITPSEEKILATHEAGHAVVGLFCPHYPPIERITIASDNPWAFGYVKASEPTNRYIQTINVLTDMICVSLGAREAEKILLSEISLGAVGDLDNATSIARALVEVHGLGGEELGMVQYVNPRTGHRRDLAPETLLAIDRKVRGIVEEQRARAESILRENVPLIELLRDMLLEHKTIDAKGLNEMTSGRNEGKNAPAKKAKGEG